MTFAPGQLYGAFEDRIDHLDDVERMITALEAEQKQGRMRLFAYRGVADADHGFFSSLYRRLWWTEAVRLGKTISEQSPPAEKRVAAAEDDILAEMHRWGLHDGDRGRLSVLRQLAVLQHNHGPTRLVDVSLNVWIALWFAVEERWDRGGVLSDTSDGRLFAIDITDRLINEDDDRRDWEDDLHRPWHKLGTDDWTTQTFAWRPSPADRRIAAQQGAFLFGGVPKAGQYRKTTAHNDWLKVDELRRCTSLPLRFHKAGATQGAPAHNATYTYRISAALKKPLRRRLAGVLGLTAGRIYPDLPGFGKFGTPWLVDTPPE